MRDITFKIGSGATPRGGEKVYLPHRHTFALIRSQNVFDRSFDETGLVFISDQHAQELAGVELQPGDLLLNITGDGVTFGRACLVPDDVLPAVVNQHVSIIRPNRNVCLPEYLLCYLTHPQIKPYIESFNAGGSRRAITKGHIEAFEIPLPPLRIQRRIAHILGTLDDKIEHNRRMNATLEALARALFKSWFVDFDPVRAKADGRPPAGMDAATAALFPDSFTDSELGKVPRGWRVVRLDDICDLAYGKTLKANDRRTGSVPVFGSNGQIGWHDAAMVQGPGIIVGRKGNAGTVVWSQSDFFPIDTTFYIVPKVDISFSYLFYALIELNLPGLGADSAVPGLNRNLAYMSPILKPPPPLEQFFCSYHLAIARLQAANEQQSRTLATLRDTLLPRLLSGAVPVDAAEGIA